jgi:hypothetical protein
MQIELIKTPLIFPGHCHQETSCAVSGCPVNDDNRPTEEQIRLLLSWRAVLTEIRSSQAGAGQW